MFAYVYCPHILIQRTRLQCPSSEDATPLNLVTPHRCSHRLDQSGHSAAANREGRYSTGMLHFVSLIAVGQEHGTLKS